MHECLNQVTAWCKNKQKQKKSLNPNSRMSNYNNKQKIGWKDWFFFFNLLYDNWYFIALYILLCYLLFKTFKKKYRCLTQGG